MPEHEPQHLEPMPEPPKLKPPGAKASAPGVRELKPLEDEAFDPEPGAKASGAKATTSVGTLQIPGRAFDRLFLLFLAPPGVLLAGLARSWLVLGRSWPLLAAPGPLWGRSGPPLCRSSVALGRSWAALGPLLAALGLLLGGLGPLLEAQK